MANSRFYSSTALETQLNGSINSGATTITLAANTGFPGTLPFTLALDYNASNEELVEVTSGSNPYTITRAIDGTSAVSHNTGAVVRHVSSARDFTDSRTHEAATADVHGVTGALVGATQAQTLTNKTLTSPTINSGALSGTFTGSPTLSGTVAFSGNPSFAGNPTYAGVPVFSGGATFQTVAPTFLSEISLQNLLRGVRASAGDSQYETRVTGDANARWFVRADGDILWGPGTGAADTSLVRFGAAILETPGGLNIGSQLSVAGGIMETGTSILYKPIQTGTETVNFSAVTQVDAIVTFPFPFSGTPVVTCSKQNSPANSAKVFVSATGISSTGFTMRFNTGDASAVTITGLIGGYHAVAP